MKSWNCEEKDIICKNGFNVLRDTTMLPRSTKLLKKALKNPLGIANFIVRMHLLLISIETFGALVIGLR